MRRRNRGGRNPFTFLPRPGIPVLGRSPRSTPPQSRPSTATRRQVATVDGQLCLSCGKCAQVCPVQAIAPDAEGHPLINTNLCRGCAACAEACPVQAIRLVPAQRSSQGVPGP